MTWFDALLTQGIVSRLDTADNNDNHNHNNIDKYKDALYYYAAQANVAQQPRKAVFRFFMDTGNKVRSQPKNATVDTRTLSARTHGRRDDEHDNDEHDDGRRRREAPQPQQQQPKRRHGTKQPRRGMLLCLWWLSWYIHQNAWLVRWLFMLPTGRHYAADAFAVFYHHFPRQARTTTTRNARLWSTAEPQDAGDNDKESSSLPDIALVDTNLLNLLSPPADCNVGRMSSTDLAYVGDVVYELWVRNQKVWPPKRTSDLQQQVVRLVRAEYQSAMLTRLRQATKANTSDKSASDGSPPPTFVLTPNENRILSRGRNAGTKTNHRKSNPAAYQDSTALEALLGYLFIADRKRCTQLLQWMDHHLDDIEY